MPIRLNSFVVVDAGQGVLVMTDIYGATPANLAMKLLEPGRVEGLAYDAATKHAVINSGFAIARSDHKNWNVMGAGGVQGGTLSHEIAQATGERDSPLTVPTSIAGRKNSVAR